MSITNSLTGPVQITDVRLTGDAFLTDLPPVEIQPLATEFFNVCFASNHNLDFTEFLQIELTGGVRPLVAKVSAEAHHQDTYYSATQNKWAEDLKTALTGIIDGHTSLGYTPARDQMYGNVDNHDGWVECVYTGRRAFFNTRAGATANDFNCEHTWPQSFFSEAEPMRGDLFQIRPSDMTANTKRANLDFGVVTTVTWSQGGSKLGYDATSQQVFEPRDVHKGNVARIHFYFLIRYDGLYNGYVNCTKMEGHFRNWHISDPVDSLESLRNDNVCALQSNRNPFVDHPEFADRISSFFGTAVRTLEPEIAVSPAAVDMGTIGFDSTEYYHIAIVNGGDDSLSVYSITSSNPDFSLSKSTTVLGAKSYEYVRVAYTSGSVEDEDSTTISITSNDADESLVSVPVTVSVTDLAGVARDDGMQDVFRLAQNSPNPFVEQTTIAFDLARASGVSLSVYNTAGQLVARLLNAHEMPPGEHRVVFDSGRLPSGVYYYRLRAGDRVQTKRMVLIH
jgi:endonuclease I